MTAQAPDPASRLVPAPAGETIHGGGQWNLLGPGPERLGEVVPADVNDSWYPPAPEVMDALRAALAYVHHTPEVHGMGLRRAMAHELGVVVERLLVGSGASSILHFLVTRVCGPGRSLLVPAPTYLEYERAARLAGAEVFRWLLDAEEGYALRPAELAAAARRCGAALVALANPNNPTGRALRAPELSALAAGLPEGCLLLVDEAYIDQAPECSVFGEAASTRALAVVRSCSKGAALAGVRLGYGVVGEGWDRVLPWEAPPWPVSLFAQAAALPALRAPDYVRQRVTETRRLRDELMQNLAALPGLEPLPTETHYFLLRLGQGWPGAASMAAALRREGVLVRDCTPYGPPLGERYLRVTTRSRPENRRIADAFRRLGTKREEP